MMAGTPKRKAGRPPIRDLSPWLEKMHVHIEGGMRRTKAARLIAERYGHEIPAGSQHVRTLASTVSLLSRHYLPWRKRHEEHPQQQAKLEEQLAPFRAEVIRLHDSDLVEEISKSFQKRMLKIWGCSSHEEMQAQLAEIHASSREMLRKLGINPEEIQRWNDRRFAGRWPWE
jgi:hypothetical protein